ncbi:MAG: hypothetical protein DRR03_02260 [Gammaproteobacteria bacterium]|nr:MAG: hypothetical protein DRR03_02260 [Gammaproteobacteria bacterium]
MIATARRLLHDRRLLYRALRIGLLVSLGWWLIGPQLVATLAEARVSPQLMELQWSDTDFSRLSINLDEIQSGGPPKDGIPAIDRPRFVTTSEAANWLDPREPVIVVAVEEQARAYPLQILMWHEIVNDTLAGRPLAVTFCPLCNASIVFDRRLDGRLLDFGTTGLLRKSDLVMYDRQTESWWQQFSGRAIVGELDGATLTRVEAQIVAFEEFRTGFPDGEVLSRETGHSRSYGRNPYRGYDRIDNSPFLLDDPVDPRLPAMERVLNVSLGGIHRLYPFALFRDQPLIHDTVAGTPVIVLARHGTLSALDREAIAESRSIHSANAFDRRVDKQVLEFTIRDGEIVDTATGSRWNLLGQALAGPLTGKRLTPLPGGVHFAFAWLAFNPDSEIYVLPAAAGN